MRPPISVSAALAGATLLACSTSPSPVASTPSSAAGAPDAVVRSDARFPCTDVQAPELIKRAEPSYPADLRNEGVRGKVVMKASLSPEGRLENIQVSASPDSRLSKLAVEAFERWRYKPAHCAGKPVRVSITSSMNFGLDGRP